MLQKDITLNNSLLMRSICVLSSGAGTSFDRAQSVLLHNSLR